MQKDIRARIGPDVKKAFQDACRQHGIKASEVIRDLCVAAIPYISANCPQGRWVAPALVPFGNSAPGVVQVHTGNGHQLTKVKK